MQHDDFVEVPFPASLLGALKPFWMVVRPWEPDPEDVRKIEATKARDAQITAEDLGCGLRYDSEADATIVANAMTEELGIQFYVVGDYPAT